jgi:GT2 family glycosyltransferase
MTSSRNRALLEVSGQVIAFLDDDALVETNYIERLSEAYRTHGDMDLGCSRTLNGVAGEESQGVDAIGVLTDDGLLLGNFAANPGKPIPIQHGIGATMSFRARTLELLGGFREYYTGLSGVREDADAFIRAQRLGLKALFVHDAIAFHVGAPQAKGRRFDHRYQHWACRNTAILMAANYGFLSSMHVRNARRILAYSAQDGRSFPFKVARLAAAATGYVRGSLRSLQLCGRGGGDPVRSDSDSQLIRQALATHVSHP